jgi:hypothetical protein
MLITFLVGVVLGMCFVASIASLFRCVVPTLKETIVQRPLCLRGTLEALLK